MSGLLKLDLPFPPSVNCYWRAPNTGSLKGRHLISARGRKYQNNVIASVIGQLKRYPKTITDPVAVSIWLFPPDLKRRDLDNYQKALFDALTHSRVWADDCQVKRMLVEWGPVIKKGKVEITISEYKTAGAAA